MTTEAITVQSEGPEHGVVGLGSPYSFADTVRRLLSVFADHGVKVFAVFDQQAEALTAGLSAISTRRCPTLTLAIYRNVPGRQRRERRNPWKTPAVNGKPRDPLENNR